MKMESRHKQTLFRGSNLFSFQLQSSSAIDNMVMHATCLIFFTQCFQSLQFLIWVFRRMTDVQTITAVPEQASQKLKDQDSELEHYHFPNVSFLDFTCSERLIHALIFCFVLHKSIRPTQVQATQCCVNTSYYYTTLLFLTVKHLESCQVQNSLPYCKNLPGFHRSKGTPQQWQAVAVYRKRSCISSYI